MEAASIAEEIERNWDYLERNRTQIEGITQAMSQALTSIVRIGPSTAAAVLLAWSHPGRFRTEAAFAALAGTNPIPASSGHNVRYRLNRGGDRDLNKALHTIVVVRIRFDEDTRAYVIRKTQEGKTKREIFRVLKRYLARRIYRTLMAESIQHQEQHPCHDNAA